MIAMLSTLPESLKRSSEIWLNLSGFAKISVRNVASFLCLFVPGRLPVTVLIDKLEEEGVDGGGATLQEHCGTDWDDRAEETVDDLKVNTCVDGLVLHAECIQHGFLVKSEVAGKQADWSHVWRLTGQLKCSMLPLTVEKGQRQIWTSQSEGIKNQAEVHLFRERHYFSPHEDLLFFYLTNSGRDSNTYWNISKMTGVVDSVWWYSKR